MIKIYIELHYHIIPLFYLIHNNIHVTPYDNFHYQCNKLVNKYNFQDKFYKKKYTYLEI